MSEMTLSEELQWRGSFHQTTFKDLNAIDGEPLTFYFGVDPSAASMTIGNLAAAMLIRRFIDHGHNAILLVGGATGLIGDPDGKAQERDLKTVEQIAENKAGIVEQYKQVFAGKPFEIVDNYDWFKDIGYMQFLREVGKHVPMRQMLSRDFVQTRLGEDGAGISYAEFSYALIQGYDFLHLSREKSATLQLCGSDQWGNCIAGVELIRRITGKESHVLSMPLVINRATGKKFGKSEEGAVWLDPNLTTPTQFYQFWINADDEGVEDYIKLYTLLKKDEVDAIMAQHRESPFKRYAQKRLAEEVTKLVHGENEMGIAQAVTEYLITQDVSNATEHELAAIRQALPATTANPGDDILDVLVATGLATSKTEARRFVQGNAIAINGAKISKELFEESDFQNGRLLLRKGKAFKDSALIERK